MLTNPDEDCSPAAFRAFLDELLDKPEPELDSLHAADARRELRVDGKLIDCAEPSIDEASTQTRPSPRSARR